MGWNVPDCKRLTRKMGKKWRRDLDRMVAVEQQKEYLQSKRKGDEDKSKGPSKKKKKKNKERPKKQVQSNEPGLASVVSASPLAALEWLLGKDITAEQFFSEYWEKKPLLVRRNQRDAYDGCFSKQQLLQV